VPRVPVLPRRPSFCVVDRTTSLTNRPPKLLVAIGDVRCSFFFVSKFPFFCKHCLFSQFVRASLTVTLVCFCSSTAPRVLDSSLFPFRTHLCIWFSSRRLDASFRVWLSFSFFFYVSNACLFWCSPSLAHELGPPSSFAISRAQFSGQLGFYFSLYSLLPFQTHFLAFDRCLAFFVFRLRGPVFSREVVFLPTFPFSDSTPP